MCGSILRNGHGRLGSGWFSLFGERALQAARADVKGPGQHDGNDKAQRYQQNHQGRGPLWQVQSGQHGRGDLDHDPARDGVKDNDPDNPPPTQFCKKI